MAGAEIPLKHLPAQRADPIARVDPNYSESEKQRVRTADGRPEFQPTEIDRSQESAGFVKKQPDQHQGEQKQQKFSQALGHEIRQTTVGSAARSSEGTQLLPGAKGRGRPVDGLTS